MWISLQQKILVNILFLYLFQLSVKRSVLTLFLVEGGGQFFITLLKKYWSEAVEIFWLFLNTQSTPLRSKTGLLY